jgi:putative Mn2+ efflux pump MntP
MGSKFVKYLTTAMAIFYMAFGFLLAFTNALSQFVKYNREWIGGILLAYGTFRMIKIIIDIRRLNREGKSFFEQEN